MEVVYKHTNRANRLLLYPAKTHTYVSLPTPIFTLATPTSACATMLELVIECKGQTVAGPWVQERGTTL
jgi:hypothetical protein